MFDNLAPTELVVAIADSQRQESMVIAQRMAAVAELLAQRTAEIHDEDPDPGYMIVTGFQRTAAEVAAAMNLSASAACFVVSHAHTLAERLPKVAAVLAMGDTDWRTVKLIITRTEFVSDSVIGRLDKQLANRIAKWRCWSRKRIINAVDATVRTMDPDAILERLRREDKRHVGVTPQSDGTAKVEGVLAAEAGMAFDKRLTELADGVCRADPRTRDQRRADAMEAMAERRALVCLCGADDCPNRSDEPAPATRIVVNVIAGAETVLGGGDAPGYIDGYGVIDADQVRSLAEKARLRTLEEPAVSDAEALRYQPTAAVERWVRMRDLTCRFPGCDRAAAICDVDHTIPFNRADPRNGGPTVPWNLKCLCREHHRDKTFVDGWRDEQLRDGTVIWTSPTGEVYRTVPGGVDLFPDMATSTACQEPKPQSPQPVPRASSPNRPHPSAESHPAADQRGSSPPSASAPSGDRLPQAPQPHAQDAVPSQRKIKHQPVLCRINDPFEPEELPPDWQPPPKPPCGTDDPPF